MSNISRTQNANLNTFISLFFRGGSILLSFILVPLTISYIKPNVYGVWMTLTSMIGWIAMLDIGIANGLKNKLSESLAEKDYEKGRMFVSSTYVIISLIVLLFIFIYFLFFRYFNWQLIFNSKFISENQLRNMVTIVSVLFLLKFISDIINIVSASFQIASVSSILLFLSNLGITISVWFLSKTNKPDLILFAFILSFIPFLISVIASIYLFKTYFKSIKPSLKYVNFKESKSVISLGTQFFILQIVYLLIFQTDNILIVQFFNPREVTNFNVAYKYYSIVIVFFTVVLTPYWTAFTEAFFKEDFVWIKSSISKLIKIWVVIFIISILMILISAKFFKIWVGEEIKIPLNLSISLCFYVAIVNWSAIFSNFLNGIGKIRLQILIAPFVGCLNLLISFLFVKYFQFGLSAIPFANALSLSFGALLGYAQYKKIVNKQASGIWNK